MSNGASRFITLTASMWSDLDSVQGVLSGLAQLTPSGLSTRVNLRGAPNDIASAVVRIGASQTAILRYHSSGIVDLTSPQLTMASAEISVQGGTGSDAYDAGSSQVSVSGATPAGDDDDD